MPCAVVTQSSVSFRHPIVDLLHLLQAPPTLFPLSTFLKWINCLKYRMTTKAENAYSSRHHKAISIVTMTATRRALFSVLYTRPLLVPAALFPPRSQRGARSREPRTGALRPETWVFRVRPPLPRPSAPQSGQLQALCSPSPPPPSAPRPLVSHAPSSLASLFLFSPPPVHSLHCNQGVDFQPKVRSVSLPAKPLQWLP